MSTPYFSIKRVASSKSSFLVTSGVAALIAFATVGVAAFSLIAYSPPTPVVLFATGLGGLSSAGLAQETEGLLIKPPDLSGHPRNVGRSSLSTRLETVRYINGSNRRDPDTEQFQFRQLQRRWWRRDTLLWTNKRRRLASVAPLLGRS